MKWSRKDIKHPELWLGFILLLALSFRFMLSGYGIHSGDFNSWIAWGEHLWQFGPKSFYATIWCDRLPGGILYLLWLLASIKHLLPWLTNEWLYKLPANLADISIAWLIFRQIAPKWGGRLGLCISLLYVLNPYTWHVSALWGQMDAVQALAFVGIIWLTLKRRYGLAAVLLVYAFLFKPHSIVLAPVLFLAIWKQRISNADFVRQIAVASSSALASAWLMSLPFSMSKISAADLLSVITQPLRLIMDRFNYALDLYPYGTVHALNFWMVFQKNWVSDSQVFMGLSLHAWGTLLFALVAAVVSVLVLASRRDRLPAVLWLAAATLSLAAFTFMTRAHDKHFYPFFAMLAMALIDRDRMTRLGLYIAMVALGLTNTIYSFVYQYGGGPIFDASTASLLGWVPVVVCVLMLRQLWREAGWDSMSAIKKIRSNILDLLARKPIS